MDIDAIAKKIREAIMDSAEDQGRTFNASVLDDVIARELRANWPAPAPANYPWTVIPLELALRDAVKGITAPTRYVVDDEYR